MAGLNLNREKGKKRSRKQKISKRRKKLLKLRGMLQLSLNHFPAFPFNLNCIDHRIKSRDIEKLFVFHDGEI